jgi:exoribonuclease II
MIAANEVMAQTLRAAGVSSIRRVVKAPERWPRIVELAGQYGEKLPPEPDRGAERASSCAASRPIRCTIPMFRWRC